MGLHQKITDRITSEPCDCGADDDHPASLADDPQAIQAFFEAHELSFVEPEWTDGTEATE